MRQMIDAGYTFLENEEGERLWAYDDATGARIEPGMRVIGTLTIAVGHTGPDVHPGQKITHEESRRLFDKDTDWAEDCVDKTCVGPASAPRRPNDNQFAAMVSLCFNIGAAAFRSSSVARMWNAGDVKAAANAFGLWVKSTSNPRGVLEDHPVLIARRAREVAMFLRPALEEAPAVVPAPTAQVMPQSVKDPGKVSSSSSVWTNTGVAVGGVTLAVQNAKPAIEAVTSAVETAKQAQTAWEGVKDFATPFLTNGHVYTVVITVLITIGAIYLIKRVVRRIHRGEISA